MKVSTSWYSHRVEHETQLVRWGHLGTPVLVFPTAGGDAEEIERMLMIKVLGPLINAGRIKVYSIDSLAARTWGDTEKSARYCTALQNAFDGYLYHEVVPAIRKDCNSDDIEIVVAGASIGAFNAMATICRHPDVFSRAICMSGTYDVERFIKDSDGHPMRHGDANFYFSSPLQYLPNLGESEQLRLLRQRFILMAHGGGRWEDPEQDWTMASILGSKGVPNRVDPWGPEYDHDWPTWRHLLPKYLSEI
ncbi:MAG: prolyl oligopeptidase family serine peptidase [Planctomycetes bacterium]|nr:prolyl oligopeptidase family serine peptidase [Planctomycetota bacterium]